MPPEDATPDPRELARKLAQEAQARALAKKLAEEAMARAAAASAPKEAPPPAPAAPKPSLAERAKRPMTAQEALRRAIEAEQQRKATPPPPPAPTAAPAPTTPPAPVAAPAAEPVATPAPAPVAATPPAAPVTVQDPAVVLANRLPGTTVRMTRAVGNRDVFKALWTAHRARAIADGDLQLMVTADVLTDAANRVPDGALFAARIDRGGTSWAAWVDAASGLVLGVAQPPDVYLAGL